ncbi:uncharacterized protein LOC141674575 [Apium graveolens]|uniref:uncharacterized protein LOC141674575 n=1 Tax=Apium graveolens TaxID=4045 RepID=UPI003D7A4861
MEIKFLELKQDIMTMGEYEAKFTELSQFVPKFVNTAEKKARRFQLGSEQSLKEKESKKRKIGIQGGGGRTENRSLPSRFVMGVVSQPTRGPEFRKAPGESVGQGGGPFRAIFHSQRHTLIPECQTCGKRHQGLCVHGRAPLKCFRCNQPGHLAPNCPQPGLTYFQCGNICHMKKDCPTLRPQASRMSRAASNRPPAARTFNMTVQDAILNTDVIAVTLFLNSEHANILFDFGATKSFIYQKLAKKLNFNVVPLREVLQVEIVNREIISVNQVHPRCKLKLEKKVFEVDLMPFTLREFDVIMGMDRLSSNGA